MSSREAFLSHVRQAVVEGNRLAPAPPLPQRGRVGYQGAGPDPVERFCAELKGAGGLPFVAADKDAALAKIVAILRTHQARRILVGRGGLIDDCEVAVRLGGAGFEVLAVDDASADSWREPYFAAHVGISNVAHLVAETGSVIMTTAPEAPRSLSLLPPVHIALARRSQILPDLFDLFDLFAAAEQPAPPSCLTVITGPSKTGDIELRLVTGVHGPGELHVIVLDDSSFSPGS
jgi:L-lactate dehydrogenase complex protein LldG